MLVKRFIETKTLLLCGTCDKPMAERSAYVVSAVVGAIAVQEIIADPARVAKTFGDSERATASLCSPGCALRWFDALVNEEAQRCQMLVSGQSLRLGRE